MDDDNDIDNESIAVQTNRGWIIESLSRIPLQSESMSCSFLVACVNIIMLGTNRIWTRFTAHWIVKENILLFRLAVPIVSDRIKLHGTAWFGFNCMHDYYSTTALGHTPKVPI